MCLKDQKGQASVFLCIVFLAVIVFVGVIIDGARIITAENQIKRALGTATKSALADYKSQLKKQYGIFALSSSEEGNLKEVVTRYLSQNLILDKKKTVMGTHPIDLYDYRIEDVSVMPIFNLTENEVMEHQILEFMKYRAPKELIEGAIDKLGMMKDATKMSEAYKQKTKVDKLSNKVAKSQVNLTKNLYGQAGEEKAKAIFVNGFSGDMERAALVNHYTSLAREYYSELKQLKNLKEQLTEMYTQGQAGNVGLTQAIISISTMIGQTTQKVSTLKKEMSSTGKKLAVDRTQAYIDVIEDAKKDIQEIMKNGNEVRVTSQDLLGFLEEGFSDQKDSAFSGDFKATMSQEINGILSLLPDEMESNKMIEKLESNINCINKVKQNFNQINQRIQALDISNLTSAEALFSGNLEEKINEGMTAYNTITYGSKGVVSQNGSEKKTYTDPRQKYETQAKNDLIQGSGNQGDINLVQGGFVLSELPSKKKVISNEESSCEQYEGNLDRLQGEIDFDEEADFSEKVFGYVGAMGSVFEKGLIDARNDIYLGEYILKTFKSSVPELFNEKNMKEKDLNFRGQPKVETKSFFNSEIEYILHGNASESFNKNATKGQILLVRFALNTLHVYTDAKKRQLATSIAAATTSWWSFGLAIPIVSNMIMCSWGMGESVLDVGDLMDGRRVPFYKSEGDWKLQINLPNNSQVESNSKFSFNYGDYLRLFLFLQSKESKLNRIEDLIEINIRQVNSGFKMGNTNTMIKTEAIISTRYLFLTQGFMPSNIKTRDGRHQFKVVIYEGY